MNRIVGIAGVYGKQCYGCEKEGKDLMVTFTQEGDINDFHDWFMTQEQAEELHKRLGLIIAENKERDK